MSEEILRSGPARGELYEEMSTPFSSEHVATVESHTPTEQHRTVTPAHNITYFDHFVPPRTPDNGIVLSSSPPPPPGPPAPQQAQPSRLRIKRRRPGAAAGDTSLIDTSSTRLPSIELSEPGQDASTTEVFPGRQPTPRLLTPITSSLANAWFASPPHTPVPQSRSFSAGFGTPASGWSGIHLRGGHAIPRPSSAFSELSVSSSSSSSSSVDTYPSYGDSCTSPDSDLQDPFVFPEPKKSLLLPAAPLFPSIHNGTRTIRKVSSKSVAESIAPTKGRWTLEMDDHLWLTYVAYLSDPMVTPFKSLPGTAPPLGVCCRVARAAKRSWKGPRATLSPNSPVEFASLDAAVRDTPTQSHTTPSAIDGLPPRSHSSNSSKAPYPPWPRKESSTRKRLRHLCKHKPTLSPHYQRLMQSRSPSPVESFTNGRHRVSSSQHTRTSSSSAFSTRDLNMTLATSTASSMQPDAPLAQLAASANNEADGAAEPTPRSRANAHQKSRSLQDSLGLRTADLHSISHDLHRLASPFQERSERNHAQSQPGTGAPTIHVSGASIDNTPQHGAGVSAMQQNEGPMPAPPSLSIFAAPPATTAPQGLGPALPGNLASNLASSFAPGGQLGSPLEIHHPRPMSGSMKRRAQYQLGEEMLSDDPDLRRSFLEDMFRGPETAFGKRRVRSRGFSMGAVRGEGSRAPSLALADVFMPLQSQQQQGQGPMSGSSSSVCPSFSETTQAYAHQVEQSPSVAMTGVEHTYAQPPVPAPASATMSSGLAAAPPYLYTHLYSGEAEHARRLGSPFAPAAAAAAPQNSQPQTHSHAHPFVQPRGLSNTFPRNSFLQGLGSIAGLDLDLDRRTHGSAGAEGETGTPVSQAGTPRLSTDAMAMTPTSANTSGLGIIDGAAQSVHNNGAEVGVDTLMTGHERTNSQEL